MTAIAAACERLGGENSGFAIITGMMSSAPAKSTARRLRVISA
jgi:hypothetical protein